MQASDAVVITLPGVPDDEVDELEARLEQLEGVVTAIGQENRDGPAGEPMILLKIVPTGQDGRSPLAAVLDSAIDLLQRRSISGATIELPDGTLIQVTDRAGGYSEQPVFRLAFVVDAAGYSTRSVPAQQEVQRRLRSLVKEVLLDIGTDPHHAEFEGRGDGMIVLFPRDTWFQRVLPQLLRGTAQRLDLDNRRHTDALRLRMATTIGPVGRGAVGYSENTVTEMCRLVDSEDLRRALTDDAAGGLAVLVSDSLYGYVVRAGHPGLDASEFQPRQITEKSFQAQAWLWIPRGAPPDEP